MQAMGWDPKDSGTFCQGGGEDPGGLVTNHLLQEHIRSLSDKESLFQLGGLSASFTSLFFNSQSRVKY